MEKRFFKKGGWCEIPVLWVLSSQIPVANCSSNPTKTCALLPRRNFEDPAACLSGVCHPVQLRCVCWGQLMLADLESSIAVIANFWASLCSHCMLSEKSLSLFSSRFLPEFCSFLVHVFLCSEPSVKCIKYMQKYANTMFSVAVKFQDELRWSSSSITHLKGVGKQRFPPVWNHLLPQQFSFGSLSHWIRDGICGIHDASFGILFGGCYGFILPEFGFAWKDKRKRPTNCNRGSQMPPLHLMDMFCSCGLTGVGKLCKPLSDLFSRDTLSRPLTLSSGLLELEGAPVGISSRHMS
jgi:hypothetical protein